MIKEKNPKNFSLKKFEYKRKNDTLEISDDNGKVISENYTKILRKTRERLEEDINIEKEKEINKFEDEIKLVDLRKN